MFTQALKQKGMCWSLSLNQIRSIDSFHFFVNKLGKVEDRRKGRKKSYDLLSDCYSFSLYMRINAFYDDDVSTGASRIARNSVTISFSKLVKILCWENCFGSDLSSCPWKWENERGRKGNGEMRIKKQPPPPPVQFLLFIRGSQEHITTFLSLSSGQLLCVVGNAPMWWCYVRSTATIPPP